MYKIFLNLENTQGRGKNQLRGGFKSKPKERGNQITLSRYARLQELGVAPGQLLEPHCLQKNTE